MKGSKHWKNGDEITELLGGQETDHFTVTNAQGYEKTAEPAEASESGSQETSSYRAKPISESSSCSNGTPGASETI